MSGRIVADAGPLIGLARVDGLPLLRSLYGEVVIPPEVAEELRLTEDRPGSLRLRDFAKEGWLRIQELAAPKVSPEVLGLDPGEAAAIALAVELKARFLLIDEYRGRKAALRCGVPVVGVPGLLLAAKAQGQLREVAPLLESLSQAGYRLSAELYAEVLRRAGEG